LLVAAQRLFDMRRLLVLWPAVIQILVELKASGLVIVGPARIELKQLWLGCVRDARFARPAGLEVGRVEPGRMTRLIETSSGTTLYVASYLPCQRHETARFSSHADSSRRSPSDRCRL